MTECAFNDDNRVVLRITGADAGDLLQDLVTNNLDRLEEGKLLYSALLTPQGKYLFDFFITLDGDALLMEVVKGRAPALAQRLMMYRLRREMAIEATDLTVSLHWGEGEAPVGAMADPRSNALGWRLYGAPIEATANRASYDALRIAVMAPETGVELIADDSYILEMGFERLNGVDFKKGCYVGQEVTARMKHKTELRKGLAVVEVSGDASPGDTIDAGGKAAGALHTIAGGKALAYLRLDRAVGEMTAGDAKVRRV
jgi:folate-binding protein YgfZ